jgi:hypothetical protein
MEVCISDACHVEPVASTAASTLASRGVHVCIGVGEEKGSRQTA